MDKQIIEKHKKIIEDLKAEFNDLVYSDDKFNYNKNEFGQWLKDCVMKEELK